MQELWKLANKFHREHYLALPGPVSKVHLSNRYKYVCKMADSGTTKSGDSQVADTPCAYGDPFMDTLLLSLLPQVEKCSGLKLFPTYSYFRVYKHGDILQKHKDRPACEISVTLCLGGDLLWPFWLEGPNGVVSMEMIQEMASFTVARNVPRREAFEGTRLAQVFLHYVDKNGPHAEWKFDKRTGISSPLTNSVDWHSYSRFTQGLWNVKRTASPETFTKLV